MPLDWASALFIGSMTAGGAAAGMFGYYVKSRVAPMLVGSAKRHSRIPVVTYHYQQPPSHPNIPARATFSTGKTYRPPSPKPRGGSYTDELLKEIDEITTKVSTPEENSATKDAEEAAIFMAVEESSNREEAAIALAAETGRPLLDVYKYLTPQLYTSIKSGELKSRGKS